jgi:TRAP transporter TAXI family solute receptor
MGDKKLLSLIATFALVLMLAVLPFVSICSTQALAGPIEIKLYSNPIGTTSYVLSFAFAETINKYSTKYHATCVESKSQSANMLYLVKNPGARETTFLSASNVGIDFVEQGKPPFDKPYTDFRYMAVRNLMNHFLISTSPEITKIEDLVGKRVGIGKKGHATEFLLRYVLDYGYGLWDKLKVSYLTFGAMRDALKDGTIDVGVGAAVVAGEGGDWRGNPATDEILTTKKCHLIGFSEEAITKAREASKISMYPISMKPKQYGATPPKPCTGIVQSGLWVVDKSMPDEYVRDILELLYDHVDVFGTYHASGKMMRREALSTGPRGEQPDGLSN